MYIKYEIYMLYVYNIIVIMTLLMLRCRLSLSTQAIIGT